MGQEFIKILIKTMGATKAVCSEILMKTWAKTLIEVYNFLIKARVKTGVGFGLR